MAKAKALSPPLCIALLALFVSPTVGSGGGVYYGAYRSFPNGDQYIDTSYIDGGATHPDEKWNAECGNAEALVGLLNVGSDFESISTLWCRREFDKASTHGQYPYYGGCLLRNVSAGHFFCFDPLLDKAQHRHGSYGTFVVALYEDDSNYLVAFHSASKEDGPAIKCCATPSDYAIDYGRCVMRYTHDALGEYYDAPFFIVRCPDRHVMTGLGTATDPNDKDLHYDWIQCCPLMKKRAPVLPFRLPPG